MWHRPMQHDQGFTGSHWMPPTGNYWLRIAPAANKMMMKNVSTLPTILMAITVRQYYTACIARWRRFVAFIKATKRRHQASTCSDRHQSDMPTPISWVYFIVKSLKKMLSQWHFGSPYAFTPGQGPRWHPDLRNQVHLWSKNDVIRSCSRLISISDHFKH